jgi:hypothetical protein
MTSDDWSLKGKGEQVNDILGYKLISVDKIEPMIVYCENDIETLRQKLIEDFVRLNKFSYSIKDIETVINKRFGIKP